MEKKNFEPRFADFAGVAGRVCMDRRLLEGEHRPTSAAAQAWALVACKDLPLKRAKWRTTICELLLPALLCSLMVIGVAAATVDKVEAQDFAPRGPVDALGSLLLPSWLLSGASIPTGGLPTPALFSNLSAPGWVPPLWLYLLYASGKTNFTGGLRFPPYRHSASMAGQPVRRCRHNCTLEQFVVVPDSPAVRTLVEALLARVHTAQLEFAAAARPLGLMRGVLRPFAAAAAPPPPLLSPLCPTPVCRHRCAPDQRGWCLP